MSNLPSILAIFFGGVAIAIQAPVNGALGRSLGASLPAATVSFGVGFILVLGLSLLTNAGSYTRLAAVPWWQWIGGIVGAYYVWSVAWGVSSIGVVSAMAALILGQMIGALVLDSVGAFGIAVHQISPTRLLAVVMVAGGLILSRL